MVLLLSFFILHSVRLCDGRKRSVRRYSNTQWVKIHAGGSTNYCYNDFLITEATDCAGNDSTRLADTSEI
jgi:hypothetical protein